MSALLPSPQSASPGQPSGLQYASRIVIGCVLVWLMFHHFIQRNPLWAVISVIIVTEPEINAAWLAFHSRILNTLIGCAVGLLLIYVVGTGPWSILLGIALSIFVCTHFIRVPGSWRVAPVTVAIVMTPGIFGGGRHGAIPIAVERTLEVLLGSATALVITLVATHLKRLLQRHELTRNDKRPEAAEKV